MKSTTEINVQIGTKFRYHIADGKPLWEVKKKISANVWQAVIINDLDYGGHHKVFSTEEITSALNCENMWGDIHKRGEEAWFAGIKKHGLKPGDFVHDIQNRSGKRGNGLYAWRCVLLADGKVKRIGLVGEPESFLIPTLYYNVGNGDITITDYTAKKLNEDSQVWGNRPGDFAELNGDFSWREKPLNMKAVTTPEITVEILKKKSILEGLHKVTCSFQNGDITIEQLKKIVENL